MVAPQVERSMQQAKYIYDRDRWYTSEAIVQKPNLE